MIKTSQPALHGVQHLADGSDPIPGIGNLPDATGTDVTGLILATGPAGFWKLDELAGDVAHDSSGNSHDMDSGLSWGPPIWGQPAGPPGLPTAKWPIDAVSLTPDTREVVAMTAFTDDFTAAIWFNVLGSVSGNLNRVIGQGTSAWELSVSGGDLYAHAQVGATGPGSMLSDTPFLTFNTWYFLALVADAGTWKMYVNGILQADTFTGSIGSGSTDTWIGSPATTSGSGNSQNVLLSCGFITPEPLTSTELLEIYETGVYGTTTLAGKVWTALGDGTADWRDSTILVEF